jgi:transcriptional regulator with XRE-family HTH domain
MNINMLLKEKGITKYRLAKLSGVSQTTLNDICNGKVSIKNCTGETLYKLAQVLNVSIESLLRESLEHRPSFETFKSNIGQYVKDMGDMNFLILEFLRHNIVESEIRNVV